MKQPLDPLGEGVRDYIDVLEGKKPAAKAQIAGENELTNDQRSRLPNIIGMYRMPCTLCGAEPPGVKFLWFQSPDSVAPFVLGVACEKCAYLDNLAGRLRDKLLFESEPGNEPRATTAAMRRLNGN